MSQQDFMKTVLASIEEGLSSLGNSPQKAIFYHLEKSFKLKKEDIPANLTEFKQALERIFGPGSPFLERIITKCLYQKLGLEFYEEENIDLVIYVDDAKKRTLRQRR